MTKAVLTLDAIEVRRFEQTILHELNLTINDGDFIMLIGPNGSGKSTLMKVLNGTMKINRGAVKLHDEKIDDKPVHEIAKHVATLTQDVQQSTFSDLTVAMNLDLAMQRPASPHELATYLAQFSDSLGDRLNLAAGKLSGGQRQALALAMCFAHKPDVLLLDEHTSALDPKAARHLMNVTAEFIGESKVTTIMVSHNLEQVLAYGNRLIVLDEGKIVADLNREAKEKLTMQELISFAY